MCSTTAGAAFCLSYPCRLSTQSDGTANGCRLHAVGTLIDTDDLVDAHGVAEILGLAQRNTVSQYQRRYPDMPRPVVDLGSGRPRLWSRTAVSEWARERRNSGRTRKRERR